MAEFNILGQLDQFLKSTDTKPPCPDGAFSVGKGDFTQDSSLVDEDIAFEQLKNHLGRNKKANARQTRASKGNKETPVNATSTNVKGKRKTKEASSAVEGNTSGNLLVEEILPTTSTRGRARGTNTRGNGRTKRGSVTRSTSATAATVASAPDAGHLTRAAGAPVRGRSDGTSRRRSRRGDRSVVSTPENISHMVSTASPRQAHVNAVRQRRAVIAERAARLPTVDVIDLVSSPLIFPSCDTPINLDDDDETKDQATSMPSTSVAGQSTDKDYNSLKLNDSALDRTFDEDNPQISLKITFHNKPEVLLLRKYQSFQEVFEYFADREQADINNLAFNLDNKIISINDTPASIDYKTHQFIHGRIMLDRHGPVPILTTDNRKPKADNLLLKINMKNLRRPLEIDIAKTDKLKILYIKCAEHLKVPMKKVILTMDGENVEYDATASDMDLEGGEIFDAIIRA